MKSSNKMQTVMKKFLLLILISVAIISCQSDKKTENTKAPNGQHMAIVEEVLQTSEYTYLRVKENDIESWLALPKMDAEKGQTYYYKDGLKMTDFVSKELNKTFPEVLFIDKVSSTPLPENKEEVAAVEQPATSVDPSSSTEVMDTSREQISAHVLSATEVLQTNQYTYIHGKENGKDVWVAVTKFDAKVGTKYYFIGGLQMLNFKSKELNRTFAEVLFADNISTTPPKANNSAEIVTNNNKVVSNGSAVPIEKEAVKVKLGKGDITIASLWENKKNYASKTVKVKGKVTKFTAGIMKKNWIHIQDGTEYSGKFDLVITTNEEVKVGDEISAEGIINVDKDFGFGYFYNVIMEDAKISK